MSSTTKSPKVRYSVACGVAFCFALLLSLAGLLASPVGASPPPSPTALPEVADKPGETAAPLPKIHAWTWMVADADNGEVLAGSNWHWTMPPASTLKTLTALTLVPRLDLDSQYLAQASDAGAEGSHVGVKAGSHYTVRDLFHGLLMPSGNDAASALANAYGGWPRTVAAMNDEAARLGAKDTKVLNPSGLDEPGQMTTAYDLALIMRASLKVPDLMQMYSLHDVMWPTEEPTDPKKPRGQVKIWTEDRLILNYYPGALAGKTGFTSQAGRTFVSAVQRDGRTLIVVLMRTAQSTEVTSKRLYDWGFANIDKVKPVDYLVDPQAPAGEIVRGTAATYDASGNLTSALPSQTEPDTGIGAGTMLLMALLLAGGVVVALRVRVIRRNSAAGGRGPAVRQPTTAAAPIPPDNSETVDLRKVEQDSSRLF
ncbi:MAG: serine hydrolase [Actinomycetes bacterium]